MINKYMIFIVTSMSNQRFQSFPQKKMTIPAFLFLNFQLWMVTERQLFFRVFQKSSYFFGIGSALVIYDINYKRMEVKTRTKAWTKPCDLYFRIHWYSNLFPRRRPRFTKQKLCNDWNRDFFLLWGKNCPSVCLLTVHKCTVRNCYWSWSNLNQICITKFSKGTFFDILIFEPLFWEKCILRTKLIEKKRIKI